MTLAFAERPLATTHAERSVAPTPGAPSDASDDAQYFEYTTSANPLAARLISRIPYHTFPAALHAPGATRLVPLDLSAELDCAGPATGPGLCAHFIWVNPGDALRLIRPATSHVFYAMSGTGRIIQGDVSLPVGPGDFLAFPGGADIVVHSQDALGLYYVTDAPLLTYLGAVPGTPRFAATRYPAADAQAQLDRVAQDANAGRRNRISILLGNARFPQSRTITHSLWAMFGLVPAGSTQRAHRHQSIALDFVAGCAPGCYSLVGTEVDGAGEIVNPVRVDWEPGMVFVTPPGYWHAHFNESGSDAHVIPIQDAGLHTYLRTLDIRFTA